MNTVQNFSGGLQKKHKIQYAQIQCVMYNLLFILNIIQEILLRFSVFLVIQIIAESGRRGKPGRTIK